MIGLSVNLLSCGTVQLCCSQFGHVRSHTAVAVQHSPVVTWPPCETWKPTAAFQIHVRRFQHHIWRHTILGTLSHWHEYITSGDEMCASGATLSCVIPLKEKRMDTNYR